MPCDTIRTSKVSFSIEATDEAILKKALEKMGYRVTRNAGGQLRFTNGYDLDGQFSNGKITISGDNRKVDRFDMNLLKREYAEGTVNAQAEQYGWEVAWSTNPQTGEREFEIERRSL